MHVHPSSPNSSISEENAATKIQANFRGYRVRKQIKDTNGSGVPAGADRGSAVAGSSTSPSSSASTSSTSVMMDGVVCKRSAASGNLLGDEREVCATKIQAGIRGYLVRKKQKLASDAATKIQANFRGFKTRQQLKRTTDH